MPRNSSNNGDHRGSQSRERDEDGRFTSGESRAQSHTQARDYDDDDYRISDRSGGRYRDDEGRFASERSRNEDRDFEDWHAYGHDRGWHAHQQGRHGQANRNRDEEGRFTSGSQGRSRDNDRSYAASSGQGRGWHGDPEGHARAGSMSHGGRASYDDDDRSSRDRSSGRERDDNGRFTGNRH